MEKKEGPVMLKKGELLPVQRGQGDDVELGL
jgi:hypothetical protein